MKKILVTDSLFIGPEHVRQIEAAGYEVERLDKPSATEAELIDSIKGKTGYILGGTERVTRQVIEAADELKVIVFTGIGFKAFIPDWKLAEDRGIVIANTPDGPTQPVAEWALTAALAMNRGLFDLGRTGNKKFMVTPGLSGQRIGIVGLGRIGSRIAELLQPFRVQDITYHSRTKRPDMEERLGLKFGSLSDVLSASDVVFMCLPDEVGKGFIGASELGLLKPGALIVSIVHPGIIDNDALFTELNSGRLRAISDYPADERFNDLPVGVWYSLNGSNAYATKTAIEETSQMAVDALLEALKSS